VYSLFFSLCVFIVAFITFAPSHALLYVAFTCGVLDSWTDVNTTAVLWDCLYLCVTLSFLFFSCPCCSISFGGAFWRVQTQFYLFLNQTQKLASYFYKTLECMLYICMDQISRPNLRYIHSTNTMWISFKKLIVSI